MARKRPPLLPGAYHIISRVSNQDVPLDEASSEFLVKVMLGYAALLGFKVITYCVVPTHFQLLLVLPALSARKKITLDQWETLLAGALSPQSMAPFSLQIQKLRANPDGAEAREWLAAESGRRYSIEELVKCVKMRVSKWYNWKHNSSGIFWEVRYQYEKITPQNIPSAAAAIDLLPVREGIVTQPADYRWSGYAAALSGAPSHL